MDLHLDRHRLLLLLACLLWLLGLPGGWLLDDHSLRNMAWPEDVNWRLRPLTYLTFWLQHTLNPDAPWAWRFVNILLHTLSAQLCLSALRAWASREQALWAAMFFALHPWQSEAVLYIFARPILLMSIFAWLALLAWKHQKIALTYAALLAALAAKEEAVALPLVLAALSYLRGTWRKDALPLLGQTVVAGLAIVATTLTTAQIAGSGAGTQAGIGPLQYLATQGQSFFRYAWQLILPYPIVFDWNPAPAPSWQAIWILVPLGFLFWQRRLPSLPWLLAGLAWLLPTSSIFPLADLAAGRRLYLAIPFVALFLDNPAIWNRGVFAVFSVSTAFHAFIWSSPESLWSFSYENTQRLRPALELSRLLPPPKARAILESRRAVGEASPDFHTELGRLALTERNAAEALRHFGKALALDPTRASHYYNRGVALLALGQKEAAVADFQRALELNANHQPAREALAKVRGK